MSWPTMHRQARAVVPVQGKFRVVTKAKKSASDEPSAKPRLKLGVLLHNMGYLSRLARNVVRHASVQFLEDMGFATGQVTLLGLIAANDGISQNDLARALLMRKSQVTALIQDLVARGLVQREDGGQDRRYNALSLTRSGTQAWKRARQRITRHSDSVLVQLTPAEQVELSRLLRKLIAANLPDCDIDFEA
jgi:DNA-binding MarR family transcriptional regulator